MLTKNSFEKCHRTLWKSPTMEFFFDCDAGRTPATLLYRGLVNARNVQEMFSSKLLSM